jgi:hypothetical protein
LGFIAQEKGLEVAVMQLVNLKRGILSKVSIIIGKIGKFFSGRNGHQQPLSPGGVEDEIIIAF